MARQLRQDPIDGVHEVGARAARRFDCFIDDRDRQLFLRFVGEACEESGAKALAYCLMGNHFHLILHCPEGGLSELMKSVLQGYTATFNRCHGFDGPLFKGRYHSSLLETNEALINFSRYLHRNPLEMQYRLDRYLWSSFPAYIGLRRPQPWLDINRVLSLGSGPDGYQRFVERDRDYDKARFAAGTITKGADPALDEAIASFAPIDALVCDVTGVDLIQLLQAGTSRTRNLPRLLAVLLATNQRTHPAGAIAAHYGFKSKSGARSAVATARNLASTNPDFANLVALGTRGLTPRP